MCVTLVEGQELALDSQGGQVFVCFKMGEQTYKSKVAASSTSLSSSFLCRLPQLLSAFNVDVHYHLPFFPGIQRHHLESLNPLMVFSMCRHKTASH